MCLCDMRTTNAQADQQIKDNKPAIIAKFCVSVLPLSVAAEKGLSLTGSHTYDVVQLQVAR